MIRYILLIAFSMAASTASAQPSGRPFCTSAEAIAQILNERYGETALGAGLQGTNALVTLYTSDETGTWTIVIGRPDGSACAVAAGQAWHDNPTREIGTES